MTVSRNPEGGGDESQPPTEALSLQRNETSSEEQTWKVDTLRCGSCPIRWSCRLWTRCSSSQAGLGDYRGGLEGDRCKVVADHLQMCNFGYGVSRTGGEGGGRRDATLTSERPFIPNSVQPLRQGQQRRRPCIIVTYPPPNDRHCDDMH